MSNHYDFIEIGTSDFDTFIQDEKMKDLKGLSIEPVKYYLDKLPERKNIIKINAGISDKSGTCDVYYVPEDKFKQYGLESWAKGCNSINKYHPTVENWLISQKHDLKEAFCKNTVPVYTLKEIIEMYKITSIDKLKIDVEGHDTVILKHYFNNCNILAKEIQFETNELSTISEIENVIYKAFTLGYKLEKLGGDCVLKR